MNNVLSTKRRKLGQHFIFNGRILNKMISRADLSIDDVVLEVGPGYGGLTSLMAEKAERVIAVEKDLSLCVYLKRRFSRVNNVRLIYGDILKVRVPHFTKVVSNIPYSISRRFVSWLLKNRFRLAVLLLQDEFAHKLASDPNSNCYSWISVVTQHVAQVDLADFIPKYYFKPPPKVDSRIVIIKPKNWKKPLEESFEEFSSKLFTFKNKNARTVLKLLYKNHKNANHLLPELFGQLKDLPLDKKIRQMSVDEIEELFKGLNEP